MTTFVALLRAINLAGYQAVAMSDLRQFVSDLGFSDVQTLLQSGNVIFRCEGRSPSALERLLATEANANLKLHTDFFVRAAKDWQKIIDENPFPREANQDPGHLVVMFLKDKPSGNSLDAVRASMKGPEILELEGKQAYIFYPNGIGRSRLTNSFLESKLKTRCTGRNWRTILRIAALLES